MRFTFLLKSILFLIGILLLNVSFGQNRLYQQVKDFTPEQKQTYGGSATLSNLIPNTDNDTIPKSILNELKQNQTLKTKFKTYDIININSSAMVRQAKSTTRSEVFNMSLGENESISFNLKPSNILSENYSMILGEENGIKEIRGFSAIPMVGKLTDVENSKVSLTVNDNFIYGFIKIGFEYYNIEPLYHFIENAPNDTYIFYSSKDIIHTRNMTCGFEEMQNETKKANDRINPEGKRMQGGCYTVLYAIASDFLMFQNYGTSTAVQNHNIAVMNDVQTNYDDEFADEVRFQIQQQWVSTCATCDPWTNSTNPEVLLSSFRSWGPTGFTQTHNLASLWTGREFDGSTVGMAYLNVLCNSSRYNVLEDFTTTASSKRVLVAHEIGHNFGSSHDEAGSGTIMAPAVNNTTTWSAQSINSIQSGYINATCLGNCGSNTATTPTNVQASDGSFTDRVQVTWSGNSGNFFRVYRNTTNSSSTATALGSWQTAFSYDDYNATAGVTYYYFVRAASNSSGANISAFSTSNAGYRSSVPVVTTPTNVQASDGTFTDRVQVTWLGTSGNFFRIYRNTTNSSSTATALGSWQTASSYDDYNATAGVTYYYFVRAASNSSGANISAFSTSNAGFRSSAPVVTTPTGVQASDGTFTDRVQVTWSGTSGNFFRVYRNTTNSTTNASVISNWQNEQFFIDDLSALAGTTYFYFVQAASSSAGANAGAFSVINSGWRSVAPVVSVPSSVNASDGAFTDKVQVTWSGTSGNYFRVYRNTTNSSSTATALGNWQTAFSYDDYTATAGITYYYIVRAASNSSGSNISAFSTSNAGYRSSVPVVTTPFSVQASDGTFTDRVQVTWSGTSGNFFRVYRNTTNSTTNASVISNWQNEQFFIDDFSALAGTTYFYFVQAASSSTGANASAFSVINSGWRSVAPVVSVPTSVNASDGTYSDKVSVTWAGTSGNYFRVIRNTSNSTSVGTVINNWQNTQLYFDDLSAVAGTTYYYFVQAASSSAGANPSSYSVINSGWRSVAPVVSVPSSINASDGSFTDRVQVTWAGTSGNFFRVYRNTTNSSSTATALGSWQTSFSYDDYNATAGVTYYYFVRAASNSSGSNISAFSTSNSGYRSTSCGTPTGLQTSQVTSTTCFLNWNAVSGATQYSLWYHNGSSWIQFGTISQNSTYITNMVAGSQYCLAVKAICGGVSSNLSAYVCLIPGFNGGGNNTQSLTTDVNHIPSAPEMTVSDMSVFPNPAIQGSEINLQYSAPTETQAKIIVYDVSGKIVSQMNINLDAGENVINMQAPENTGLYICRMIFQNGSLLQTKLIVH